jgi:hypothetical protein
MLEVINPEFDIVIGEKSFVCKALSLNSLLKLSRQLKRDEYIANAKLVAETMPVAQRGKFMLDALNELAKPSANTDEFAFADSLFSTVHGITEIIKYAIMKYNDVKLADLESLIEDNFTTEFFKYLSKVAYKILGVKTDSEEVSVEPEEDIKKKSDDTMTK